MRISVCILFVLTWLHSNAQLLDPASLDTARVYTSLEQALADPERVYRLDLSRQKLKSFPPEILQLTNLNELRLNKNKIGRLPDDLAQLTFLQRLACQHCELDTIGAGIMHLRSLRVLDLGDNFILFIPENIDDLQELEYLILWDNPISYYPNSLGLLEKLVYLDLLHNQMGRDTQDRLINILPQTRIVFSPPCQCEDNAEGP